MWFEQFPTNFYLFYALCSNAAKNSLWNGFPSLNCNGLLGLGTHLMFLWASMKETRLVLKSLFYKGRPKRCEEVEAFTQALVDMERISGLRPKDTFQNLADLVAQEIRASR